MAQLLFILFAIVLIAFGAFFIQSGQLGHLSFGRIDFGTPLKSLSQGPIIKYRSPDETGTPAVGTGNTGGGGTTQIKGTTIPTSSRPLGVGTAFSPPGQMPAGSPTPRFSDFYGRVKLGTVNANLLSFRANFQSGEKINVTGWYIKAMHGGWYVPQAVNVYDPSGLAEPGDILLGRGEMVAMYSGVSPVGVNFRLNLCTGYLNNSVKFNPALPRQCPGGDTATLRNYSSQCQDYVPGAVSNCKEPKGSPPIPYYDDGCRAYLNQFNFKGCFNTYRSEPGFLKSEWRVWMGTTFSNPKHDRVFLLDKQGYLVDWREY